MDHTNRRQANHQQPSPCEEVLNLIPAYSMGATDPQETALVESLLPECPEAQVELEQYHALAEGMLYVISTTEEPAPVENILRAIEADEAAHEIQHHHEHQHHVPPPEPIIFPVEKTRRGWLMPAALIASVALLVTLNIYWMLQFQELQREQQNLTQLLIEARQQEDETPPETRLAVGSGEQHHRQLSATEAGNELASALISWVDGSEIGSLFVNGLPTLPQDQTYQLWLVNDEQTISLGTFKVGADGAGALIFQSPVPITNYQTIGISVEQSQGSENPTTPHVVIGQI